MGAVPVEDVEFPESEVGILGPLMRHDAQLRDTGGVGVPIRRLGKRLREELAGF
jgi:hypothetical protein